MDNVRKQKPKLKNMPNKLQEAIDQRQRKAEAELSSKHKKPKLGAQAEAEKFCCKKAEAIEKPRSSEGRGDSFEVKPRPKVWTKKAEAMRKYESSHY